MALLGEAGSSAPAIVSGEPFLRQAQLHFTPGSVQRILRKCRSVAKPESNSSATMGCRFRLKSHHYRERGVRKNDLKPLPAMIDRGGRAACEIGFGQAPNVCYRQMGRPHSRAKDCARTPALCSIAHCAQARSYHRLPLVETCKAVSCKKGRRKRAFSTFIFDLKWSHVFPALSLPW